MATHTSTSSPDRQADAGRQARPDSVHDHQNALHQLHQRQQASVVAGSHHAQAAALPGVTKGKDNQFFAAANKEQDQSHAYRESVVNAVSLAKPSNRSMDMAAAYNKTQPPEKQIPRAATSIIADVAAKVATSSPFATPEHKAAAERYQRGEAVALKDMASDRGIQNMAIVARQYVAAKALGAGTPVDEARRAAFMPLVNPGA